MSIPFETTALPRFPLAEIIAFESFNNAFAGRACYVVGRGPTEFDYETLADVDQPIFFINDAVCLEKFARSETFFFAHDPQLLVWLDGKVKSTAVLPIDGKVFVDTPGIQLNHAGKVVFYHWRENQKEDLLHMDRDQLAQARQLYTHTGTVHSLLHFLWYCGFGKVSFVGCDCITENHLLAEKFHTVDGYDARLTNLSGSSSGSTYEIIGRVQVMLTALFGFEAVYLGTPAAV